jgi:ABC-type transporter MlaC component
MAEGVSMGQTQRSEFSSVIRNNGGTIDGLLAELSKRANNGA